MNKRKLPKAITRSTDDLRQTPAAAVGEADQAAPTSAEVEQDGVLPFSEPNGGQVMAQPAPPRDERPVVSRVPTVLEINAVRRRSQAFSIVERHATYSAAGGIIPVPIVNVASVTAIIVRMVKRLAALYEVPFERDRARAIVVALAGGTMPTGLAAVTTSTLYYVVPGAAFIGLAVSSVAAVACTRNIGRIFVEHFESGATLQDISVSR
jgi:uncharacterized protein (DUF697 family)